MKLAEYLSQQRGRQAALAKAIGAHAPDVSRWASGERPVPLEYCTPIEKATGGSVTRRDLCGDWQTHWPELQEASHG